VIGAFFIPNPVFEVFGWIALIGSLFFIMVQLLLLVDFAHDWAEKWIQNYENNEEESGWWWILLGSSVGLYIVSGVLTILMYISLKNKMLLTIVRILCKRCWCLPTKCCFHHNEYCFLYNS
jgi:hypothetical protein